LNGEIVGFVNDLMFQTRIESVAERIGVKVYWVGSADQVTKMDVGSPSFLEFETSMLNLITQIQPKLCLFDLGNNSIPWGAWIPLLKNDPGIKHIPIVCYGSHVDTETFKKARQAGADEVLARSRFVTTLPELIRKYVYAK
jgi:CheY-like chemotaxis protein